MIRHVENPHVNAGDVGDIGLISELGRSLGGGNGNPLQYSCLENSIDKRNKRNLQSTVHGITELDMTEQLNISPLSRELTFLNKFLSLHVPYIPKFTRTFHISFL